MDLADISAGITVLVLVIRYYESYQKAAFFYLGNFPKCLKQLG
jgi:hypothetical protein